MSLPRIRVGKADRDNNPANTRSLCLRTLFGKEIEVLTSISKDYLKDSSIVSRDQDVKEKGKREVVTSVSIGGYSRRPGILSLPPPVPFRPDLSNLSHTSIAVGTKCILPTILGSP